jgi:hypothetical protein
MCAIYIPSDKNVFYRKYECDIFDVLQAEIELFSVDGNVAVIGDRTSVFILKCKFTTGFTESSVTNSET